MASSSSTPHFLSPPQPHPPTTTTDILSPSPADLSLSSSSHLTRQELLRRRLRRLRRLSSVYKHHYWALMEEIRVQYREYYWQYGVSPYKEEEEERESGERDRERELGVNVEGSGENNNNCNVNWGNLSGNCGNRKLGLGLGFGDNRCVFVGCKLKAMALTSFCHLHILSDPQQKLYKACNYVIKSAQAGPIICGKPILRSTVPSLCTVHFQKAQKHVTRALKKAGLNVSSSSKLAPKFHVIVAEYVRQIQAKRKAAQRLNSSSVVIKEEETAN